CRIAPAEKDDTDTELALKIVFQLYPEAEVTIFGAFGGRIDHMLSNIFLVSDPELAPFMRRICLRDKQNKITYYPEGSHKVLPEPGMTYVSFLHEGDGELTILGAKYELTSMNYFQKKIYSSNEFVDGPIQVIVPNGYVIVIQTKDRS
ncbi:MAG: thiamine diphosphokinase, partial [Streptococcus salivarius]